jgi:type III pantothenate kinase
MLIAIDIGNTNVVAGVFPAEGGRLPSRPRAVWRLSTRPADTADEYGLRLLDLLERERLSASVLTGAAVASVVPSLDPVIREVVKKHLGREAFFIGPATDTGVKVRADFPAEVGADRIANAAAAFHRVKGPCIVADFGTAATFDCVNGRGEYLGGVIAPGPLMAAEALARKTAKLPLVDVFHPPSSPIGRNTVDSISSGLYHGYVGLTREILIQLKKAMKGNPKILATGGLAGLLAPSIKGLEVLPDLTLDGIRLIWERQKDL